MADVLQTAEKPKPKPVPDSAGGINLVDLASPVPSEKPLTTQPSTAKPAETVTSPPVLPPTFHLELPPVVPPTIHLDRPTVDADLNHKYVYLDPGAWNNDSALRNIYDNGVLKLHTDLDGRRQFGIRVANPKSDPVPEIPIDRGRGSGRGVSLQFRFKF